MNARGKELAHLSTIPTHMSHLTKKTDCRYHLTCKRFAHFSMHLQSLENVPVLGI